MAVGVLAVAGTVGHGALAPASLAAISDCAALALAARPSASLLSGAGSPAGGAPLAEALAAVAGADSRDRVISAALDIAAERYGARAGFVCLPAGPAGVEIAGWRGLDRERLGAASRHPGFTRLVSGTEVAVVPPTDATVAHLTAGAEFAVCLPVVAGGGPGALVLLIAEQPDTAGRQALEALRISVTAGLRAAQSAAAAEAADTRLASLAHSLADPVLIVD